MGRGQCWGEELTSSCKASVRLFDGDMSESTAPPPLAAEDCWMASLTALLAPPLSAGSLPPLPLESAALLLCCAPGDDLR